MGGSDDNDDRTLGPDEPAIIVSTQDLYLSRALNRGYARRAPRWPIDFALFNNDCLLVFDEIQLMSDGLASSTQFAAFREKFGVFGRVPCVWMSATLNPAWLDTVDFAPLRGNLREVRLEADDLEIELVRRRLNGVKRLSAAPENCRTTEGCAEFAAAHHRPGERTLIITNTVQRAREIFARLRHLPGAILLHSRFRPADRLERVRQLDSIPDEAQIVVSTQVLEAGIDISAHRLITDIAPWSSLVQRFGRVNRYGEADGEIWWVDQPTINAKYGRDPTITFYTHISDQYGPFHTKVINSTVRDALHVLDGLLGHDTDLRIKASATSEFRGNTTSRP
jgi:CRISPR-associated endonuclease/helicase Cas3